MAQPRLDCRVCQEVADLPRGIYNQRCNLFLLLEVASLRLQAHPMGPSQAAPCLAAVLPPRMGSGAADPTHQGHPRPCLHSWSISPCLKCHFNWPPFLSAIQQWESWQERTTTQIRINKSYLLRVGHKTKELATITCLWQADE